MTLQGKILYCRKKAGLSQEALAERLGVSRQAVSKWETGEAVPEIGKLLLLAKAFDVTTDWLLSEDEPEEETKGEQAEPAENTANTTWVDSIPGLIGKLLRKYGWLYGLYTAICGAGFVLIGGLARGISKSMFSNFDMGMGGGVFSGETVWYDEAGNIIAAPFGNEVSSFAANNPVATMGTVIMIIGAVLIVAGTVLAVYLKRRGRD